MNTVKFATDLTKAFGESQTDVEFGNNLQTALANLLASATVTSVDAGTGGTGTYAGKSSASNVLKLKTSAVPGKPKNLSEDFVESWKVFKTMKYGDDWTFSDSNHSALSKGSRLFSDQFGEVIERWVNGGTCSSIKSTGIITLPGVPSPTTYSAAITGSGKILSVTPAKTFISDPLYSVLRTIRTASFAPIVTSLVTTISAYVATLKVSLTFDGLSELVPNLPILATGTGTVV